MTEDNRLPDHSRLVFGTIGVIVGVPVILFILLLIFALIFSDVMH